MESNPAVGLAGRLQGRVPVIYCDSSMAAVGRRWKNQFSENSKLPAMAGYLPEMTHNDVMGWEGELDFHPGVVLLRHSGERPPVRAAFDFIRDLISARDSLCGEFAGVGSSLLSRMFSHILLGDYTSVYLALLRGLDPTPIDTIGKLKSRIGKDR
jgi:glucose/mannose-6-phosphate isomerase